MDAQQAQSKPQNARKLASGGPVSPLPEEEPSRPEDWLSYACCVGCMRVGWIQYRKVPSLGELCCCVVVLVVILNFLSEKA